MTPEKYKLLELAKLRAAAVEHEQSMTAEAILVYNDTPWLIAELEEAWIKQQVLRDLIAELNPMTAFIL